MKTGLVVATLGIAAISTTLAFAQSAKDPKKPSTPPDTKALTPAATPPAEGMQLPPGMTEADMQACIEAGTPGEMHAYLAENIGTWKGKSTMWMTPEADPAHSECVCVITPMMDGRFVQVEVKGEMPGMGPYHGLGVNGFDNTAQKFQSTWIDNCGTTMMIGTGQLSSDASTLTWNYTYSCPITKKPTTMREIERRTGKDAYTLEMHGIDPKSGKEFKMMEIAFTRAADAGSHDHSHDHGHQH